MMKHRLLLLRAAQTAEVVSLVGTVLSPVGVLVTDEPSVHYVASGVVLALTAAAVVAVELLMHKLSQINLLYFNITA